LPEIEAPRALPLSATSVVVPTNVTNDVSELLNRYGLSARDILAAIVSITPGDLTGHYAGIGASGVKVLGKLPSSSAITIEAPARFSNGRPARIQSGSIGRNPQTQQYLLVTNKAGTSALVLDVKIGESRDVIESIAAVEAVNALETALAARSYKITDQVFVLTPYIQTGTTVSLAIAPASML